MTRFAQYFVDGDWMDATGDAESSVVDPSTEQCIGTVKSCSKADIDRAFGCARRSFSSWCRSSRQERRMVLERLGAVLACRADAFVQAYATEVGAPVFLGREKLVPMALTNLKFIIDGLEQVAWTERIRNSRVDKTAVGVIAAVTPWNHPLHQMVAKVGGAIAAGCTVVLKPSELAPTIAQLFAQAVAESGLPAGAFNLVWGGADAGRYLVSHHEADLVSFTGSREVGTQVIQASAGDIRPVALELGGKSAAVVLDDADADTDAAVRAVFQHCTGHSGQTCVAQSRLIVPHRVAARAAEQLVALAAAVAIGDPRQESTRLGPVSNRRQFERVNRYIELAEKEGARRLTGASGRAQGFERGFFIAPTVFSEVTASMTLAREEVFGPVLALMTYDTEAQALQIANATRFGLSGAVWSGDVTRAEVFAGQMRTGQVVINGAAQNLAAPFGGRGASGFGRENGRFSIEAFLELKTVQLPLAEQIINPSTSLTNQI
jgi:aldehyde dehydrogenase (NAD+)